MMAWLVFAEWSRAAADRSIWQWRATTFRSAELDLVVAINAAHYGSLLQVLIPAAVLNQFVPAVNDYSSHSE
jgi:hypothetical protein